MGDVRKALFLILLVNVFAAAPSASGGGVHQTLDRTVPTNRYGPVDQDGDGTVDGLDNCPAIANPEQTDADQDGIGDACDPCRLDPANDVDGDGVCGDVDNCPGTTNAGQTDADTDGVGDLCDNCPAVTDGDQTDTDGDGLGDACDSCPNDAANDIDSDGACEDLDNCPAVPNALQANADGDAQGNACDACPNDAQNDVDGDGICGNLDNCPTVFNPGQQDSDANGIGNACEAMVVVQVPLVDQDIRSDAATLAQHFQQGSSRVGRRNAAHYRTLAWADVSTIPAGANIVSATLVYHTTSGDPLNIDGNGDDPPYGGPITVEVREVLRPWNYDEPLTYPENLADNERTVSTGETTWRDSLYPTRWAVAGAGGVTDSGPAVASTTVTSSIDTRFDFTSPDLADVVQRWVGGTSPNHGLLLRAIDADENSAVNNRKVFCGKGFPLETSTTLAPAVAGSHRPYLRIEYISVDTLGSR